MKAAAVSWSVRPQSRLADFFDHASRCLDMAQGADLVVLPEHFVLEIWPMIGTEDVRRGIQVLADLRPELVAFFQNEAKSRNQIIFAGSWFARARAGGVVNVAEVFAPEWHGWQPKNVLTQFELVEWGLVERTGLASLPNNLGVLVCYDSEFPEAARGLCEAGTLALAVPAFTESAFGFHRVRSCCLARAVENQVFVLHASLIGGLDSEPCPAAYGTSAIIAPSIEPFPAGGVLAETVIGVEAAAIAEIDFDALLAARGTGDVRNWDDRGKSSWLPLLPGESP